MKDDLTALLEAIRLIRAELETHAAEQNAPRALARIAAILEQPQVVEAIGHLDPAGEAPSITPSLPYGTRVN
jgi:hypothetical protein